MDEAWYAGAYKNDSNAHYLYTGQYYWTMTPSNGNMYSSVFCMYSTGYLNGSMFNVSIGLGVRPVINLKADTIFAEGGDGTSSNPYVVM